MRNLYAEHTANYPRLKTDKLFADYENKSEYNGFIDKTIKLIEELQLLHKDLWQRFVDQYRQEAADAHDLGWRGEYWGKMMRGACFTYFYTHNPELYEILCDTVEEMMSVQEESGRMSTYHPDNEFDAWDVWSRKYVLLGMQYFLEICDDELFKGKIIKCMCRQVDYIMSKLGGKDGKMPITASSHYWRGLNSSSLLEPIVRLYSITGEKEYFDFATHIVDCGGMDVVNIFDLAYEDKMYPYQYPTTKAYEMISCFEGLLEYYRVTGVEKYKTAVINFANKLLKSELTIVGSCGCTHELFDHSTVRQANTTNGKLAQETCVTVTLMKFFYQVTLLTGDTKYTDAYEISMYNAFLGAVNTEGVIGSVDFGEIPECIKEPLPFDSYSPLVAGMRGCGIGGIKVMSDKHYYGCCACIGAAGSGLISKMALLSGEKGFLYNLYIDGSIKSTTPAGNPIEFITSTKYPVSGNVKIKLSLVDDEKFEIIIRKPYWSEQTSLTVNGEEIKAEDNCFAVERTWADGDTLELELDMRTEALHPTPYGHQIIMTNVMLDKDYTVPTYDEEDPLAKHHIALRRGPIILAQENRLGYSVDEPVSVKVNEDGYVSIVFPEKDIAPYEHLIEVCVPLTDGSFMHVTDYGSTGKLWNEESKMAAWILTD